MGEADRDPLLLCPFLSGMAGAESVCLSLLAPVRWLISAKLCLGRSGKTSSAIAVTPLVVANLFPWQPKLLCLAGN